MAWIEQTGTHSWRIRYTKPDGTLGSLHGFPTKTAAKHKAAALDGGHQHIPTTPDRVLYGEWTERFLDAIDVERRTEDGYRSKIRNHLLPHWATTPLTDITPTTVGIWAKTLRTQGLAPVTVSDILKLHSLILSDAVDEGLLAHNPARLRRRGRRRTPARREKPWATPEQVLAICDRAALQYGTGAALLILTGAYTGARWGELTGLRRHNLHLDTTHGRAHFTIDPDNGALHEADDGHLWLGPPKTPESARTITLPDFLLPLLTTYLNTHHHSHVFITPTGQLHRRSNFARRAMRPAADGTPLHPNPDQRTSPLCPGLTFHGLRHSHKTWMIADGIPEVAQARRLGHRIADPIKDIYSHVAEEVATRLHHGLDIRWTTSLTAADSCPIPWR